MATKKTSSRKAAGKPTIEIASAAIPKLTLNMPLDARRVTAIQKCLEKGTLRVTLNKVDLATGRIGDGWLYD